MNDLDPNDYVRRSLIPRAEQQMRTFAARVLSEQKDAALAALREGGRLVANGVTLEMEAMLLAYHRAA